MVFLCNSDRSSDDFLTLRLEVLLFIIGLAGSETSGSLTIQYEMMLNWNSACLLFLGIFRILVFADFSLNGILLPFTLLLTNLSAKLKLKAFCVPMPA